MSRPIHELLGSSNPVWGFGAFPLKTTFVVRMYIKALSKISISQLLPCISTDVTRLANPSRNP